MSPSDSRNLIFETVTSGNSSLIRFSTTPIDMVFFARGIRLLLAGPKAAAVISLLRAGTLTQSSSTEQLTGKLTPLLTFSLHRNSPRLAPVPHERNCTRPPQGSCRRICGHRQRRTARFTRPLVLPVGPTNSGTSLRSDSGTSRTLIFACRHPVPRLVVPFRTAHKSRPRT